MEIDWEKVKEVADRYRQQILSVPGVVGMSTGIQRKQDETKPCIRVDLAKPVERGSLKDQRIPWELEGIPVDAVVTGEFIALEDHS